MDEVLHLVARTQKLCCSPMLLEFLGVRKPQKRTQEIVVSEDIFEENKSPQVRCIICCPVPPPTLSIGFYAQEIGVIFKL